MAATAVCDNVTVSQIKTFLQKMQNTDTVQELDAVLKDIPIGIFTKPRQFFFEAGYAKTIVDMMNANNDVEYKDKCAMMMYCQSREHFIYFVEAGAMEALVEFLPYIHKTGLCTAANILSKMVDDHPDLLQRLRDIPGVIDNLEIAIGNELRWSSSSTHLLKSLQDLSPSGRKIKAVRA